MDTFVTRGNTKVDHLVPVVKKTSEPTKNTSKRKYYEEYLAMGSTVATVGTEERPMCVLCFKPLIVDSMGPNT